jgi:hypothetical protein
MESIRTDIEEAIDIWLNELTVKEEKYHQIKNTQYKIQQTLLQIQFEGEATAEIQFIANLWIDILNLLNSESSERGELLMKFLLLFEAGAISRDLAYQLIVTSLD